METLPYKRRACSNCPFKKDTFLGWLGMERAKEIADGDSFVCHKTTSKKLSDRLQCAGHMIMQNDSNQFVRLARALHIELDLSGKSLIFDTKEEFIKHHSNTK